MPAQLPKAIQLKNVSVCKGSVSTKHRMPWTSALTATDHLEPYAYTIIGRYKILKSPDLDREKLGFWLVITSNHMTKQATIRNWSKRRLRNAIVDQLKLEGFDKTGKKIEHETTTPPAPVETTSEKEIELQTTPPAPAETTSGYKSIVGMAEIFVHDACAEVSFEEVQRQASLIVQSVLQVCGWPPNAKAVFRKVRK